jgi:hypothetical protein
MAGLGSDCGNQHDPPEQKKDQNPDIVDLRDVIDYIREWGGKLEVGHFSTGNYYHVQTSKLACSGWNLREVCRRFVREASKVKAGIIGG